MKFTLLPDPQNFADRLRELPVVASAFKRGKYHTTRQIAHRVLGAGNYVARRERNGTRAWRLK